MGRQGPLASYRLVFSKSVCAVTLWDRTWWCLRNSWRTCTPSEGEREVRTGKQEVQEPQCVRRQGSAPGGFRLPRAES